MIALERWWFLTSMLIEHIGGGGGGVKIKIKEGVIKRKNGGGTKLKQRGKGDANI